MKTLLKTTLSATLVSGLMLVSAPSYAGLWDDIKADAAKAWEKTKENATKVGDDGKEAYEDGKATSYDKTKKEAEEQGLMPVKQKEDEAGIPVD